MQVQRKSNALTRTQQEVYDFILNRYNNGYRMPTIGEIARNTGRNRTTTWEILQRMQEKGYIRIKQREYRGIELVGVGHDRYFDYSKINFEEEELD